MPATRSPFGGLPRAPIWASYAYAAASSTSHSLAGSAAASSTVAGTLDSTPSGGGSTPDAQPNIHAAIGAFNHPLNSSTDRWAMGWVPDHTGTLSTLYIALKTASGGYGNDSNGNGQFGNIELGVYTANADGTPNALVGNLYTAGVPSESTNGGVLACTGLAAAVTAGTRYIVSARNTNATPSTEFFSINNCHVRRIVGANDSNVSTNADYPYGKTRHGLDPRAVNIANGVFGAPTDGDGWCVPTFWCLFADGHEEGQPYYYGTRSYTLHTSRTYTIAYDCIARRVLMHGSGRASAGFGSFNVTATVRVNGSIVASGITLTGTHNVAASMGIGDLLLEAGDSVQISISNTTNVTYPAFDAAMLSLVGGSVRNVLPICLIG